MATTLQNAYDRIRLRLGLNSSDPALTDANLTDFVNASLRQADNLRDWWWNEASRSWSTAADDATQAFAADSRKVSQLSIGPDVLPFRTKLDMIKFSTRVGRPRFWTVEAGQIKLYPTPDDVYTVNEIYQKGTTALASTTDEFDWPDYAVDLPILMAATLAAAKIDPSRVQDIAPEIERTFIALADEVSGTLSSAMPKRRMDWTP